MMTRTIAAKVLETVDAGLVSGLGQPIPGRMCVEAAVCYAMGLPHGDEPSCVSPALRKLKILLNDSHWSSSTARARGMRRLALAQLGSAGTVDETMFAKHVVVLTVKTILPPMLRRAGLEEAARGCETANSFDAADAAYAAADAADAAYAAHAADAAAPAYAADAAAYAAYAAADAADAAYAAADAAYAAADAADAAYAADAADAAAPAYAAAYAAGADAILGAFAEGVVQILIAMDAPGIQWLDLAPL